MIDTEAIRNKTLFLAVSGQLTEHTNGDRSATDLLLRIATKKELLEKTGLIKKEKKLPDPSDDEKKFDIPSSWLWVHMGDIFTHNTGKALNASDSEGELLEYITTSNLYWDRFELKSLKKMRFKPEEIEKYTVTKGDLLVCEGGDIGRSAIWNFDYDMRIQNHIHRLRGFLPDEICTVFYYYIMMLYKQNGWINGRGIGLQGFSAKRLHTLVVPLPPYAEQIRIAERISDVFITLDSIDKLQQQYSEEYGSLKNKLIDAGIKGELTKRYESDGNAFDLYHAVQEERRKQEKSKTIKKIELFSDVDNGEVPFIIPNTWKWTRFGNISYIVRGGSPRPIKQYITTAENGINWIKIGDVEKGGKYIYEAKEKIIPEGEKHSRHVYSGDFLLTNSMSFGRPYISKIEGCIHDGWLLIRNLGGFDPDYLYYLLSSSYLAEQFSQKASGSTVDNLNIDKVNTAIIPLPPLAEQKRIAARIDELLAILSR